MTENKNFEEEYQYVEETGVDENPEFNSEESERVANSSSTQNEYMSKINNLIQQPNIRRNSLIAVCGLFFLIFILKFMGKSDIEKKKDNLPSAKAPIQIANNTNPMLQKAPMGVKASILEDNTLNNLVDSQRNMQSNISALREQIGQLTNQVNTLSSTNQALVQQVAELAIKLISSQEALQELLAAKKAQPVIVRPHPNVAKVSPAQQVHYFVQAVIPGRAWLISTQGATMTVRVGSKVPGLGVVQRIDALQGRVVMSSGRVIAFSQAD
jgi:intracellular multiplication protein IcmG